MGIKDFSFNAHFEAHQLGPVSGRLNHYPQPHIYWRENQNIMICDSLSEYLKYASRQLGLAIAR